MQDHKFSTGQVLTFTPRKQEAVLAAIYFPNKQRQKESPDDAAYEVVRCLPVENGEYSYRIRNTNTGQERIAGESQLKLRTNPESSAALAH